MNVLRVSMLDAIPNDCLERARTAPPVRGGFLFPLGARRRHAEGDESVLREGLIDTEHTERRES